LKKIAAIAPYTS